MFKNDAGSSFYLFNFLIFVFRALSDRSLLRGLSKDDISKVPMTIFVLEMFSYEAKELLPGQVQACEYLSGGEGGEREWYVKWGGREHFAFLAIIYVPQIDHVTVPTPPS
jgi:hypothetical protein